MRKIELDARVMFGSLEVATGDAVSIDLGENRHIVLITNRSQTFDPALFERLDVELAGKKAVVVKSSQHFHALFSKVAAEILYAASPGVTTTDFKSLPYQHGDTTQWGLAP